MANLEKINQYNVEGEWYCTTPDDPEGEGCIACGLCYGAAPDFFAEDEDGNAYVYQQPTTNEALEACLEQLEDCPVNSIGRK